MKQKIIGAYLFSAIIFSLYSWLYGDYAHKSYLFNLGVGLVWPTVIFPSLGKIVGAAIIIGVIGFAALT
jgi:predicted membrane-bound spermidine synthase